MESQKLISNLINSILRKWNDQHGFSKHKSGLTNPIALCDEMADYVDKGRAADVIYLDILRLWIQSATAFLFQS